MSRPARYNAHALSYPLLLHSRNYAIMYEIESGIGLKHKIISKADKAL